MNEQNLDICRQIKAVIDAAREQGVWCAYPQGVWILDQWHQWPYHMEPLPSLPTSGDK